MRTLIQLLYEAPGNPVFRMVICSWRARVGAFLLGMLTLAEIVTLLWLARSAFRVGDPLAVWFLLLALHGLALPIMMAAGAFAPCRPFSVLRREELWMTTSPPREIAFGALLPPALGIAFAVVVIPIIITLICAVVEFKELMEYLRGIGSDWQKWAEDYLAGFLWGLVHYMLLMLFAGYVIVACSLGGTMMGSMLRPRLPVWVAFLRAPVQAAFVLLVLGTAAAFALAMSAEVVGRRSETAMSPLVRLAFVSLWAVPLVLSALTGTFLSMANRAGHRWFAVALPELGRDCDWLDSEFLMTRSPTRGRIGAFRDWLAVFSLFDFLRVVSRAMLGSMIGGLVFLGSFLKPDSIVYHDDPDSVVCLVVLMLLCVFGSTLLVSAKGLPLLRTAGYRLLPGRLLPSVLLPAIVASFVSMVVAYAFWLVAAPTIHGVIDDILDVFLPFTITLLVTWFCLSAIQFVLLLALRNPGISRAAVIVVAINSALLVYPLFHADRDVILVCLSLGLLVPLFLLGFFLHGGARPLLQRLFDVELKQVSQFESQVGDGVKP